MKELKLADERIDDLVIAFDKLLIFLTLNGVLSDYHTNQLNKLLSPTKEIEEDE